MFNKNQICFTLLPRFEELLYIFATIDKNEKIKISHFNQLIIKCRQLIFENADVIAHPCLDESYGICIVVKDHYYESGKLNEYLKNHNLKGNPPAAVPKYIYEESCMYTIFTKIAPKWNLIGNYFIKGRNFLTNNELNDCIQLQIKISDSGDTTMVLSPNRAKLPNMTLEKLELPVKYHVELEKSNQIIIEQNDYKTVRVLPSLKKGRVISVWKKLDSGNLINNYPQMKRHWKNTYGYRLPECETNIIYFQISFFDGSPIFTYPSVCVRPYEPVFLQKVHTGPIIASFITDMIKRIPTLLGQKYPIPSYLLDPTMESTYLNKCSDRPNVVEIDFSDKEHYPDKYKKSLTQNSAFVVLPTQKSSSDFEKKSTQPNRSALSQFVSQLQHTQPPVQRNNTQSIASTQLLSQSQNIQHYGNIHRSQDVTFQNPTPNITHGENSEYSAELVSLGEYIKRQMYNSSTSTSNNRGPDTSRSTRPERNMQNCKPKFNSFSKILTNKTKNETPVNSTSLSASKSIAEINYAYKSNKSNSLDDFNQNINHQNLNCVPFFSKNHTTNSPIHSESDSNDSNNVLNIMKIKLNNSPIRPVKRKQTELNECLTSKLNKTEPKDFNMAELIRTNSLHNLTGGFN